MSNRLNIIVYSVFLLSTTSIMFLSLSSCYVYGKINCETRAQETLRNDFNVVNDVVINNKSSVKTKIQTQVLYKQQPASDIAISPSQELFSFIYPPDKEDSRKVSLIVYNSKSSEYKEIYKTTTDSWDLRSSPQWLGNNYIFFMTNCGSGCRGIAIVDSYTGAKKTAGVFYPSFNDKNTYIADWSGNKFVLNGLVNTVSSKTVNGVDFMIFTLINSKGEALGEEVMIFKNKSLVPVQTL